MRIDYMDKHDQQDPAVQRRELYIRFDKPEEVAALNKRGTPEAILEYTRTAMNAYLKENTDAH